MKDHGPITRDTLLAYFLNGAKPREAWSVGMEVERMPREAGTGRALPYEGQGPTIRRLLERYAEHCPADPILEGENLIGLDGPWGSLTLEPGGQVEWSSRPARSLDELRAGLARHVEVADRVAAELGLTWLEVAVEPRLPLDSMLWMPKARYGIMRPYLARRGRLAERMMAQTTSIQCAFDYASDADWSRKFRAAAWLAPIATALFANSSDLDGRPSGYRSMRQAIWRETAPERCGIPPAVFEDGFGIGAWLEWTLQVPTVFRYRARGLVPAGGVPFGSLLGLGGCDAMRWQDWEIHLSTLFTEVRSYTYLEVRSADLQPRPTMFSVPCLWTGLLYDDRALDGALELGRHFATAERWSAGMECAARDGVDGVLDGIALRALAGRALGLASRGFGGAAAAFGDAAAARADLATLARRAGVEIED